MTHPLCIKDAASEALRYRQMPRRILATLCVFALAMATMAGAYAVDGKEMLHGGYELGAVIDVRKVHAEGARVLAVTPGGAGDRMGLRVNDRLRAINGHDLANADEPAVQLSRALREQGGAVRLQVVRDGKAVQLTGTVDTLPPPAAVGCGFVTQRGTHPTVSQDIYLAGITMIDGRSTPLQSANRYRLDAGQHVLVLAENIDRHRLSDAQRHQIELMMRRNRVRGSYKALVVDVSPGIAYYVGARLLRDKLDAESIRTNAYWEPVVWQERPMSCP